MKYKFEERFLRKIQPGESGCMLWSGRKNKKGYGYYDKDGKAVFAHRYSYRTIVGEIPNGYFVCHKCDVPSCVNPEHLFVGTPSDNIRDCISKGRRKEWKKECKYGHEYSIENTGRYPSGGRYCRECNRINANNMRRNKGIPQGELRGKYAT